MKFDKIGTKIANRANKIIRSAGISLMTQADMTRLFGRPESGLPVHDVDKYLSLDNSWLKSLERMYADFKRTIGPDTQWKQKLLRHIKLEQFREDNPYVWQISDKNTAAGYGLTYYHIQSIDRFNLLDRLVEEGAFGASVFNIDGRLISRDLLDSIAEIYFLDSVLGESGLASKTLLDIGAGYGRLGHRLTEAFPDIQVLCTDGIALSTFICNYYLRYRGSDQRAKTVPLYQIEHNISISKPDVAVNIHSWSECPLFWVRWWLDILKVNRIKYLMIVPNSSGLTCREATKFRPDYENELKKRGYRLKAHRPKYESKFVQQYGVSPSTYYFFELAG